MDILIIITIFLVTIAGILCIWFIFHKKLQYKDILLKEKNIILEQTANLLDTEKQKNIRLETEYQQYKYHSEQAKTGLEDSFRSTAQKIFEENNKNFLGRAKETFDKYITQSEGQLEKQKTEIKGLVTPLSENLQKNEVLVKELGEKTQKTFGNVQTSLATLKETQEGLQKETNTLVTALKNPRVRGRWGEIGLRRLLEYSGLKKNYHFQEQQQTLEEEKKLRPDFVINLPNNKKVIIDSKLALDAYLNALETTEEQQKQDLLKKHARDTRDHMKALSKKNYWNSFEGSLEFVVMYIEVEPAFGSALEIDKELITDSIEQKIVFATPTTLIALLGTVAFAWKQNEFADNAQEIWNSSKELHERLRKFTEHIGKIGRGLETATTNYNQAIGSWTNRVEPTIRKLEGLNAPQGKTEIPALTPQEKTIRQYNIPSQEKEIS